MYKLNSKIKYIIFRCTSIILNLIVFCKFFSLSGCFQRFDFEIVICCNEINACHAYTNLTLIISFR